jgi:hypothetical protein
MNSPQESANVGRPDISEGQAASPRKTESFVKRLGDLRDGLLLLAGVLYLLGYLSWALYALETGIGLVPVLDSQYFTAGIVPALIILLFALSVRWLRLHKWLKRPLPEKTRNVLTTLTYCCVALMIILGVLRLIFRNSSRDWMIWLAGGYVILFLAAAFFSRARGDSLVQVMALFLMWCYTILGAFWLFLGYDLRIFPHLPSELGGPKPRCVQLDVDVALLSPETRSQLFGSPIASATPSVFRSVPLNLIFDGTEYVLLSERPEPASLTNRVYRLRKDCVKAVFPCPGSETKSVPP